jgi:hypothetical protein
MSKLGNRINISCQAAEIFEWNKWREEIPYIKFDNEWLVKVIPPLTGAVVRFLVVHKDDPNSNVSVYLDCYAILGYMDKPYWEVYPVNGDTARCAMSDTESLLSYIRKGLTEQISKPTT